jgi:uncharacterized protein (TIGR03083 family)
METHPTPWITALRHSHDTLAGLVAPLTAEQIRQPSYASEWSIAQVLSHLGSQAEIFSGFLSAGLSGEDPPGPDSFPAIWDGWNGREPEAQVADSVRDNNALIERFEGLSPEQLDGLHLSLFGMVLDAAGLARMRLSEHAVHTWDVAVALDPTATIAPDSAALLVDTLGQMVARVPVPDGPHRSIHISVTNPDREFTLQSGDRIELSAETAGDGAPDLEMPSEALIRLVYGRLDAAHTPPLRVDNVDLDGLRRLFPGF